MTKYVAFCFFLIGLCSSGCTDYDPTAQPVVFDAPPPNEVPAVAPLGPKPSLPVGSKITDARISEAVKTNLTLDLAVPAHLIDVSTHLGVVKLRGATDNILAQKRAVKLARATRGVRAVINRLVVRPVKRADGAIKKDIQTALRLDPVTEHYEVTVQVKDGVVTLTGEVESWQEKNLAERVSASVKGVREIKNDLRIVYKGPRKDHEIRADVAQRLENDVYVEESGIKVQVKDATVELIGVVGSAAEKQRARMDAWVAGTQKVNAENLKVKWRAQQSLMRKKRPENISDSGVARAVKDAYLFDPRLVAGNVNVRVDDGIAVLTGQVSDLRAKKAATETALNTVGVYHVRNLIDVRPQTRVSDDTLVQRVSAAIDRDPYLSANKVTVKAINGKVYLNGNVENRFRKKHAASIAGRIDGVVSVQNNLIANQRWSRKQDWWLKREVEAQLLWDPFLPRRAIAVTVDRGTVILSGTVRGWLQRMKAEQDAWRAGAKEVQTRIRIENGPKALQP